MTDLAVTHPLHWRVGGRDKYYKASFQAGDKDGSEYSDKTTFLQYFSMFVDLVGNEVKWFSLPVRLGIWTPFWESSWSHLGTPNLWDAGSSKNQKPRRHANPNRYPNRSLQTLIPKPLWSTKGKPWLGSLSGNLRSHEPGEAL